MKFILSLFALGFAGVAMANSQISSVECTSDDYELTVSVNGNSAHSHLNRGGQFFNHFDGTVVYTKVEGIVTEHTWTITPADRSGRRTVITTRDEGGHRHGQGSYVYNPSTSPVIFPEGSCHID